MNVSLSDPAEQGDPPRWALGFALILALALRLWHVDWGLPYLYEEATPLFKAWGFWNWAGIGLDFNPRFFNYPALSFIVQFAVQAAHLGVGYVVRAYPDLAAFQAAWSTEFPRFVLIGRLPGVLFDAGTVMIVGALAGRLVSRRAGVLAALMAAVNPLQVRLAHMIAVDSMLAFFCSLAVLLMLDVARSGGLRRAVQAGAVVGLAAATKYTGAVLLAPLVCALVFGMRRAGSANATARTILLPVLVAGAVFILLNPFIVLDAPAFLRDFGFEQTHMAAGHFGIPSGESTPLFYFGKAIPAAVGWPAAVLGILGIIRAARSRDRRWVVAALGLGILIVVPQFWAMRAERYLLPAIPLVILLFASGLEWFYSIPSRTGERTPPGAGTPSSGRNRRLYREFPAVIVTALAAFLPPLMATIQYHRSFLEPDTRAGAAEWIRKSVSPGAAIVLTPAGINVDSSYVQLPIPYVAVGLEGIAAMYDARWYTDMDLLVGSDFDRARYLQEPERYAPFLRFFYDSLDTRWRTVWHAESDPARNGPRIWLYAPPRDDSRAPFPADLIERLSTVTNARMLTVFTANLAAVLDSRGRADRARQVRDAAAAQLRRRFPSEAAASIDFLKAMAPATWGQDTTASSPSR